MTACWNPGCCRIIIPSFRKQSLLPPSALLLSSCNCCSCRLSSSSAPVRCSRYLLTVRRGSSAALTLPALLQVMHEGRGREGGRETEGPSAALPSLADLMEMNISIHQWVKRSFGVNSKCSDTIDNTTDINNFYYHVIFFLFLLLVKLQRWFRQHSQNDSKFWNPTEEKRLTLGLCSMLDKIWKLKADSEINYRIQPLIFTLKRCFIAKVLKTRTVFKNVFLPQTCLIAFIRSFRSE